MILITYIGASYDPSHALFQLKKGGIYIIPTIDRFSKVTHFLTIVFYSLLNPVYK